MVRSVSHNVLCSVTQAHERVRLHKLLEFVSENPIHQHVTVGRHLFWTCLLEKWNLLYISYPRILKPQVIMRKSAFNESRKNNTFYLTQIIYMWNFITLLFKKNKLQTDLKMNKSRRIFKYLSKDPFFLWDRMTGWSSRIPGGKRHAYEYL